jgi:ankyrin repeat protein
MMSDVSFFLRGFVFVQFTPLLLAAKLGFEPILATLLDYGADINATDPMGNNSLHIAAKYGYPDCISTVLKRGININAHSQYVPPPLSLAAADGHTFCVSLLLSAGADMYCKDDLVRKSSCKYFNNFP